jgi:hypothetical protein
MSINSLEYFSSFVERSDVVLFRRMLSESFPRLVSGNSVAVVRA